MKLIVNGEIRELPEGTTIESLLQILKLLPRNVAVELNRRIVRSDRYTVDLKEGDSLEIVTFVGGG